MALRRSPFQPLARSTGPLTPKSDAVDGIEKADIAGAADPDTVTGEQVGVFLNAALEILTEALDVFLEGVVGLVLQAPIRKAWVVRRAPQYFSKNLEDFFALAHAIEEGVRAPISRACVPSRGRWLAMRWSSVRTVRMTRARAGFDDEKFLDCFAIAQPLLTAET